MRRRDFAAGVAGLPLLNATARCGFQRMHAIMAGYVGRREVPGVVMLISKFDSF